MDRRRTRHLDTRILQLLEGRLPDADQTALRDELLTDPEALDRYVGIVSVYAGLHQTCIHTEDLPLPDLSVLDPAPAPHRTVVVDSVARHRRLRHRVAAAAAVVLAAVGALLWRAPNARPAPDGPTCATLVGVRKAEWPAWTRAGFVGSALRAGRWQLTRGLAQIQLDSGPQIILHAPCEFTLHEDNQLTLHVGRLWAHVPPQALSFSVTTVGAHLVDYGTDFGVIADETGQTSAHVFAGSVGIRPAAHVDNFEHRLTQGQAVRMDRDGVMSPTTRAQPEHFVRDLSQVHSVTLPGARIDLADLVGGGNGFGTGRIDHGLDPGNGRSLRRPLSERHSDRERRYHVLADQPYVDGVFVPDADKGVNLISSTGLAFRECPDTDGTYYDGVFDGAKMSIGSSRRFHPGELRGQAYGTALHPALNLHSNAGITFDLEAIRQGNPGTSIRRFTALCGISETVKGPRRAPTEFWALVDGEVRFHFRLEPEDTATRTAVLRLKRTDRFLTLVTTTRGDAVFAWAFWADPSLELRVSL